MILRDTIPGTIETGPVPCWGCDVANCPAKVSVVDEAPVESGWWECRGVHLCPDHAPEEDR